MLVVESSGEQHWLLHQLQRYPQCALQAYCLAATPAGAAVYEAHAAADEMREFMTAPWGALMPVSLADAVTGQLLAQGGVDLKAVWAAGDDIEHGELPLENVHGDAVAVLIFNLRVCAVVSELMRQAD